MFEEMEQSSRNNQNYNNQKTFAIEGITNKEVGKKIKSFSKTFLKIEIVLMAIAGFFTLINFLNMADYMDGGYALIFLLIMGLIYFFMFVGMYFGFLIMSGFGAMVEDINAIKALQMRQTTTKTSSKKIDTNDYEDLPRL